MKTRVELVGGRLCGTETIVTLDNGLYLPAVIHSAVGDYLRTAEYGTVTDQDGTQRSTGRRRYEYVVPAALRGLPRPKRDTQCCEMPGHGCPTWGPQ